MENMSYEKVIREHLGRMKELDNPKNFKAQVMMLEALIMPLVCEVSQRKENRKVRPEVRICLETRCPKCKTGYKYILFKRETQNE